MKVRKLEKRIISWVLTLSMILTLLPVSALAAEVTNRQPVNADFKIMGLYALRDNGRRVSYFSYETRETEFLTGANISYPESWFKLVHVIEKSQPVTLELYEINDDPAYLDTDRIFMPYLPTDTADGFGKLQGEEFLGERLGVLVGVPVQENIVPLNEGDDIFTAPKVGYEPIEEDEWLNIIYDTISGERKPQLLQNFYSFGYEGNRLEILDADKDAPVLDEPPTEEPPIEEPPAVDGTDPTPETEIPLEEENTGAADGNINEQTQTNDEPTLSPESEAEPPLESQPEDTQEPVDGHEEESIDSSNSTEIQSMAEFSEFQNQETPMVVINEIQDKNDSSKDTEITTTPGNTTELGADRTDEEQPQTETPSETADPEDGNNTTEPLPDEKDPNAETDSDIETPTTDQETPEPETPPATEVIPPITEEPVEEPPVESEIPEQEEIHYLPESAVFPPDQDQLFSSVETDDESIQNIVLWDGHYQTDDGEITRITEGGRYVIVMQPCTPETSIYNSFLGFDVPEQSEALDTFESINSWEDLMAIRDELACSGDPVDLLSGSFTWNYRDLALYG